jgi:hypothetical protein
MTAAHRPSPGGHWPHRGSPFRPRKVTGRVLPQARQRWRRGPQTPQYQRGTRLLTRGVEPLLDPGQAVGEARAVALLGADTAQREGFTPEQPRTMLTTTPGSLADWAITHLRPAL